MKKNLRTFKLFGQRWSIGGINKIKNGSYHSVIYAPNKQLHHIYDNDAILLRINNGLSERADVEKTKMFIIMNILDKGHEWNNMVNNHPKKDERIKVIYEGITVKWITFSGFWDNHFIETTYKGPIGYRTNGEILYKDFTDIKYPLYWRNEDD